MLDDAHNLLLLGRDPIERPPWSKTNQGTCIAIHHITGDTVQTRFFPSISQMSDASRSRICSKRNSWRDMRKPFRCPVTIQEGHRSRILLVVHTNGRKPTCLTLRQVPTIHQPAPLPIRRTDTYDITLAIRTIGPRHHGTFPHWKMSTKIRGSRHRLLYQLGRSRTISHNNRKEHTKLCLEDSNMPIRHPTSPRVK